MGGSRWKPVFDKMQIPHVTSLLLAIYVLEELQYVILGIPSGVLNALRKVNAEVFFNLSLGICHNKVHLMKGPMKYNSKHDNQPNGKPVIAGA